MKWSALGSVFVALTLLVSGCSNEGEITAEPASPCFRDVDAVAIIAANTANVPAPQLSGDLRENIKALHLQGARPVVISASGKPRSVSSEIRWNLEDPDGGTKRGNDALAEYDMDEIAKALNVGPSSDGLDMFEAITKGADELKGAAHPLLILMGSGLSDTGVLDTTQGILAAESEEVAEYVRQSHPAFSLEGYKVEMVDFGYVADPQPYLPSPTRDRVIQMWKEVLEGLGAEVCVATTGAEGESIETKFVVETTGVNVIPICTDSSVTYSFDSSALSFAKDSAEVPENDDLNKVAQIISEMNEGQVVVTGHTDSDGKDQANLDLSQRRADAVASLLRKTAPSGVEIEAHGVGESQLLHDENGLTGLDLIRAQGLNRRVDIEIIGSQVSCPTS